MIKRPYGPVFLVPAVMHAHWGGTVLALSWHCLVSDESMSNAFSPPSHLCPKTFMASPSPRMFPAMWRDTHPPPSLRRTPLQGHTSLFASMPEEVLCRSLLTLLSHRDLARLLQVDRMRGATDAFWSMLALECQLVPLETEQASMWLSFLRGLSRRDRFVQACEDVALALHSKDSSYLVDKTLAAFPEFRNEPSLRLSTTHPSGGTLMHVAARCGRPSTLGRLLRLGADLDVRDECGMTALAWAAWRGHFLMCYELLYCGSDVRPEGSSPMNSPSGSHGPHDAETWAERKGFGHIALLLRMIRAHARFDEDRATQILWRREFLLRWQHLSLGHESWAKLWPRLPENDPIGHPHLGPAAGAGAPPPGTPAAAAAAAAAVLSWNAAFVADVGTDISEPMPMATPAPNESDVLPLFSALLT